MVKSFWYRYRYFLSVPVPTNLENNDDSDNFIHELVPVNNFGIKNYINSIQNIAQVPDENNIPVRFLNTGI
jgi:hypothetical protein